MSTESRYLKIKKAIDNAQREYDQLTGALEQIKKRLKEKHGISGTLASAKKQLRLKQREEQKLEAQFERELAKVENSEWAKQILD